MIRVFKHYVPNAVLLLGVIDLGLLIFAAELGWVWRSHQLDMGVAAIATRWQQLFTFSDGFWSGRMLSSIFKRLFDVAASAILLILSGPLILLPNGAGAR